MRFRSHIWQIYAYELRRSLRRKGYLFATFGIPIIVAVLLLGYRAISSATDSADLEEALRPHVGFNLPFDEAMSSSHVGYVDLSGEFPDAGELSDVLTRYADEASAQAAQAAGEISRYYVISEDYLTTGDVTVAIPQFSFEGLDSDIIRDLILATLTQDAAANANAVDATTLVERLRDPIHINEINLQRPGADQPDGLGTDLQALQTSGGAFIVVYGFALMLTISTMTTNGYLMQTVIEEKETRLIEILISTVRPTQLLTGKILALGTLGLLQVGVWLLAGFALIRLAINLDVAAQMLNSIYVPVHIIPLVIVYFLLMYLLFAALFGTIGALSTSMQEGPQYAGLLSIPVMIPLYFTFIFIETPDAALPTILSLIPPMSPLSMVQRLAVTNVPAWQIIVSVSLLALSIVGVLWLAGRLFRVQTLLAGQRPKLREIPRLIRG